MFSVMTLLAMASAAVTYGWTTDGRDGVRYIVQVPPSQWDQVRTAGNLRCVIAPEVQGHVTEIVVQVGNGEVPRNTPAMLAGSQSNVAVISNDVSDRSLIPAPRLSSKAQPARSNSTTSLMKPAPQDAGMSFPGGFQMKNLPETMNQRAREVGDAATAAGNQFREAVRGAAGQLGTTDPNAASNVNSQRDPRARLAPTTAPTQARESALATGAGASNQRAGDWFDLNDRRNSLPTTAPTTTGFTGASGSNTASTASGGQAAASNDTRGQTTWNGSADPDLASRGLPGGFGQFPNGVGGMTPPSTTASTLQTTQQTSAAQNNSIYANATQGASSVAYDPKLTPAQARMLPPNGYTFDRQLRAMDREGYLLDSNGNRVDQQGNPIMPGGTSAMDPRARLAGTNGVSTQPSSGSLQTPAGAAQGVSTNPLGPTSVFGGVNNMGSQAAGANWANTPGAMANSNLVGNVSQQTMNGNAGQFVNGQTPPGSGISGQGFAGNVSSSAGYPTTGNMAGYPGKVTGQVDPRFASAGPSPYGGSVMGMSNAGYPTSPYPGSAINQAGGANAATSNVAQSNDASNLSSSRIEERSSDASGSKGETTSASPKMDAQPIFNGLLLISIVANLYLLRWLQNMRSHFRDLVASKRAAGSVA